MWREISEELRHLDSAPAALRRFGLVVGGVFVAIGLVIAWFSGTVVAGWPVIVGGPGLLLVLLALVVPRALGPVQRAWMGLAFVLGYLMTRVILTVVFVALVVPIGLVLRLVGKEVLARRRDPAAASYWLDRPAESDPLAQRLLRLY